MVWYTAGAQKNLGPAGVTLLIGKKSLIDNPVRELPKMMPVWIVRQEGRAIQHASDLWGVFDGGRSSSGSWLRAG